MSRLSAQSRLHPLSGAKQRMVSQPARTPLRVSFQRGKTYWRADADLVDLLFDEYDLRLKKWLKEDRATIVKTGPHRTVYHLDLPEGRFYLKHYRIADWQAQLQNLVRPTKAELEWKTAHDLINLQINTFEPIALGKTRANGLVKDSFLISREIENVESVQEFVQKTLSQIPLSQQSTLRRRLAIELGRITARMHAGGLIHRDYHAGNLLVRVDPDQSMRLWLIDLHATHTCRRLTLSLIEKNLSLLSHFFSHDTSKVDRFRFIQSYWTTLRDTIHESVLQRSLLEFPESVRRIESYCRQAGFIAFAKADRKWSRGNRRLIIADSSKARCRGIAELGRSRLEAIRENPEYLLSKIKSSDVVDCELDGMVMRGRLSQMTSRQLSRKTFIGEQWSPVRRAWEIGHAFLRRGVATPRPMLFVEQNSGEDARQYLLTENIAGAVTLKEWLLRSTRGDSSCEEEQLIRSLADLIQRMHAFGFDHAQLASQNVLVSSREDGESFPGGYHAWVTNLQHVKKRKRFSDRQTMRRLMQLNASLPGGVKIRNSLRVKFLKLYLGDDFSRKWKQLWQIGNSENQKG